MPTVRIKYPKYAPLALLPANYFAVKNPPAGFASYAAGELGNDATSKDGQDAILESLLSGLSSVTSTFSAMDALLDTIGNYPVDLDGIDTDSLLSDIADTESGVLSGADVLDGLFSNVEVPAVPTSACAGGVSGLLTSLIGSSSGSPLGTITGVGAAQGAVGAGLTLAGVGASTVAVIVGTIIPVIGAFILFNALFGGSNEQAQLLAQEKWFQDWLQRDPNAATLWLLIQQIQTLQAQLAGFPAGGAERATLQATIAQLQTQQTFLVSEIKGSPAGPKPPAGTVLPGG